MLISVADLQALPQVSNQPIAWLNQLVAQIDSVIKDYCKRDLEKQSYQEYYSGDDLNALVLRQWPAYNDSTLAVYWDPNGYWGQGTGSPFPSTSLLTLGADYALELDSYSTNSGSLVSNRGILRRLSGSNASWMGFWPGYQLGLSKLSASRLPGWPRGMGNLKVIYNAGLIAPLPGDLNAACLQLAAYYVRTMPLGGSVTSESLGGYSYSMSGRLNQGGIPELGEALAILRRYREISL
jgi:hypothetical protein